MPLIGLVRVTSDPLLVKRQHTVLAPICTRVFEETSSRKLLVDNRPELLAALDSLEPGDALAVEKVGRLGGDLAEDLIVLADRHDRGVAVKVLDGSVAEDAASREHMLQFGRDIAQARNDRLTGSIKDGLREAQDRGIAIGRPRVVDDEKRAEILSRRRQGESLRSIAQSYGISTGTVHNVLAE